MHTASFSINLPLLYNKPRSDSIFKINFFFSFFVIAYLLYEKGFINSFSTDCCPFHFIISVVVKKIIEKRKEKKYYCEKFKTCVIW